ncbi:MAG: Trm112 family protein [Aquificae bacterium]|nr:Trm112 family protein [Aquificota bacterium]
MIYEEILKILACPECKGELAYLEERFICERCRLSYPVVDGIPDFLVEDAKPLSEEELKKLKDEG